MQQEGPYTTLRCAAHCANLAFKDHFANSQVHQVVSRLAQENPKEVPAIPDTRWVYLLRQAEACLRLEALQPADRNVIERAVPDLRVADDLVNQVQGDSSTLWQALLAWEAAMGQASSEFVAALSQRFYSMATDVYLLIAYMSPAIELLDDDTKVQDKIRHLLEKHDIPEDEINGAFLWCRPATVKAQMTEVELIEHFKALRFPKIGKLCIQLMKATPSEASVERAFSYLRRLLVTSALSYRRRASRPTARCRQRMRTSRRPRSSRGPCKSQAPRLAALRDLNPTSSKRC
jgi:hypothetical protein